MAQQNYNNAQDSMGQPYGSFAGNPNAMMQPNQSGMFASQQQGYGQQRSPQSDYRSAGQATRSNYAPQSPMGGPQSGMFSSQSQGYPQQRAPQSDFRAMTQQPRPNYMQQAAGMNMGQPGQVYGQGMQPNAQQSQFQQQQMRQQMMAMQQQGGAQGTQPQRQASPNPYSHQPYNLG